MPDQSAAHKKLVGDILLDLGQRADVMVWPNATGAVRSKDTDRWVRFGRTGSTDIFAVVTPFGRFLGLEVKTGAATQSARQKSWAAAVERRGGLVRVVRSIEDARKSVEEAKGR